MIKELINGVAIVAIYVIPLGLAAWAFWSEWRKKK